MTDTGRPDAADQGGNEDPDERVLRLARLHADLLDHPRDREARHGSPEDADPDPDADTDADTAVFAALDHVRAELADAPVPAPPPGLLAGIDRALAAERSAAGHPPPERPGPLDPRRGPPVSHRVLVAALIALVVAGLAGAGLALTRAGGPAATPPPVAAPPSGAPADLPAVRRDDPTSALATGLGGAPAGVGGPLASPARLAECLAAHGVPAGTPPAGVRRVLVDGRPQVLVVLPTGTAARFRVLVVGEGCSATTPLTVADSVVGR